MRLQDLIELVNQLHFNKKHYYNKIQTKSKELLNSIGNKNINKITSFDILQYKNYLQSKGNKPATINNKLAYASIILKYAEDLNLIKHKIKIPFETLHRGNSNWLTQEQIQLLLDNCGEDKTLLVILSTAINTGLRISEVINIKKKNISNGYIRIYENKVNQSFSVPINNKIKHIMDNWEDIELNYNQIEYRFRKLCKKCNLTGVTIHTLRHTFCSRLVEEGVHPSIIQRLANHKSFTTTQGYLHIADKSLELAVNKL